MYKLRFQIVVTNFYYGYKHFLNATAMADAEYIEITNNDIADVKKESDCLHAEEHSQSTDVKSEQQLEQSSEPEVVSEDKPKAAIATLLKGDEDNDDNLHVAADKSLESNQCKCFPNDQQPMS